MSVNSNQYLEVSITKLKTNYKATCSLFPQCKGVGVSEQLALQSLSTAISRYLAGLAEKAFQTILSSNQYTEVLLQEGSKEYKKVFPISGALTLSTKEIDFVYKPSKKSQLAIRKSESSTSEFKDVNDLLEDLHRMVMMSTDFEGFPPEPIEGFGIPLSLN